jgi:hypothetical protein
MKRPWIAAGIAAGLIGALVAGLELVRGIRADACAERIVAAAAAHDRPSLEAAIKNPSVVEQLLRAGRAEHLFTRPRTRGWFRVGLSVEGQTLVLLLDAERLPECLFLRDYEEGRGAFAPAGSG